MAGSYKHCVDDDGRLLPPERLCSMLECMSGDVYEACQEMYGMIWWLAAKIESDGDAEGYSRPAADQVEDARTHYREGLARSPGVLDG